MAKDRPRKHEIFSINDTYHQNEDFYSYKLVHKKKWRKWLLLLPLIAILFFSTLIQCERQIDAVCLEPGSEEPIEGVNVDMHYTAYMVKDDTGFKWAKLISRSEITDSAGVASFKKCPCSVFSYLFCFWSKAHFSAKSECYAAVDNTCNFHYTRRIKLVMDPRYEDAYLKVVDKETGDPLPDASIVYRCVDGTKEITDSATTDANGIAIIHHVRYCSDIEQVAARKYGYADTIATNMPVRYFMTPDDNACIPMRPIKERFTFFVKDKETKQPIPDALAVVTLTHPNGSHMTSNLHTSIDGKGIAVYEDAFILSTINIHASKLHYKDGDLEGGPWTVDKFKDQPDDVRTVWLEAEPYKVEFINVDSINGNPIPGVKNRIKVTDPAGNVETYEETSNSNGVFPVLAKEGSRIEIISDCEPGYKQKTTIIKKFESSEKVKMQPRMVTMRFRTLDFYAGGSLLPGCTLKVSGSISGGLPPSNSGNGVFDVEARYIENLSIRAMKQGYLPNNTSVKDAPVSQLSTASQDKRDIPLKLDLPPCDGGINIPKSTNENNHVRSYSMGKISGTTYIDVDFYSIADYLTVYDGTNTSGQPIFPRTLIKKEKSVPVSFTKGAITVIIESSAGNSSWEYEVRCPN